MRVDQARLGRRDIHHTVAELESAGVCVARLVGHTAAVHPQQAVGLLDHCTLAVDRDAAALGVDLVQLVLDQLEPTVNVGDARALADVDVDFFAVHRRVAQQHVVGQFVAAQVHRDDVAGHAQLRRVHARDIDQAALTKRHPDNVFGQVGGGVGRKADRLKVDQATLGQDLGALTGTIALQADVLTKNLNLGLVELLEVGKRQCLAVVLGEDFGHAGGTQFHRPRRRKGLGRVLLALGGINLGGVQRLQVNGAVQVHRGFGGHRSHLVHGVAHHAGVAPIHTDDACIVGGAGLASRVLHLHHQATQLAAHGSDVW